MSKLTKMRQLPQSENEEEVTEDSFTQDQADPNDLIDQRNEVTDMLPSKLYKNKPDRPQLPIESIDFGFFDRVYKNYNAIWQQVLNLSNETELVNYVAFERILRKCNAIDACENAFCRFLLQTCKVVIGHELLVDYRQFFHAVFQALKRKRVADAHVNFVNAELFVIDHFWAMMFKKNSQMKEGYANFTDFKAKMF